MPVDDLKIDDTLRLSSHEHGLLQIIADFARTTDPKVREDLTAFLGDVEKAPERVRRIGNAMLGESFEALTDEERAIATRFLSMAEARRRYARYPAFRDASITGDVDQSE